jgi:hypothetical protein
MFNISEFGNHHIRQSIRKENVKSKQKLSDVIEKVCKKVGVKECGMI